MPIATDLPDRRAKVHSSHLRYRQNLDNLMKNIETRLLEFALYLVGFTGVISSLFFGADQVHAAVVLKNCVRNSGITIYLEWEFLVIIHSIGILEI
jgi:hypothetical protein